ncbi:hypothetical protein ACFQH5_11660 [Halomonas salifodinae]|uniref:CvpA family protein n=1 Tax=Halomonas salifodinae TaxID=438745 RepID=A0ABW2EZQ2_9GAMM
MYRGFALGVVFISCFYVVGYIYKYSFFGHITNDFGWLSLVSVDYVGWGVYALLDIVRIHFVMLVVCFAASLTYFSQVVGYFYKSTRVILKGDFVRDFSRAFSVLFAAFIYYIFGVIALMVIVSVFEDVTELGRKDLVSLLNSGRQDEICFFESKECFGGKLMYSNGDVFVFYHHSIDEPMSGRLMLVSKREAKVEVGWNPGARDRVNGEPEGT